MKVIIAQGWPYLSVCTNTTVNIQMLCSGEVFWGVGDKLVSHLNSAIWSWFNIKALADHTIAINLLSIRRHQFETKLVIC